MPSEPEHFADTAADSGADTCGRSVAPYAHDGHGRIWEATIPHPDSRVGGPGWRKVVECIGHSPNYFREERNRADWLVSLMNRGAAT